ncbi:DUF7289 family protein [Halomarina pelagica]|uniref:DUF7289 family protein n=1 Tax=Halomarina pelagica TaxID=2961599 RepID=UPI0020C475F9|nr:hypothetical protein [Halomarina sp. BND7]
MAERAVSEVLSFVLIFSLVVTAVGIVYASGLAGLESARSAEQVDNAARAFDVLADNMADIHRSRAPGRKTEIKLSDASLAYSGTATEIDVTVEGVVSDGNRTHFDAESTPIVYGTDGEARLVYEGGAVVRRDGDYVRMLREPPFLFRDDRVVLAYVETVAPARSVSGSETVLVRGERTRSALLVTDEAGDPTLNGDANAVTVNLTVTAADGRVEAWRDYLVGQPGVTCGSPSVVDEDRRTVACRFETEELAVSVTSIELGLN